MNDKPTSPTAPAGAPIVPPEAAQRIAALVQGGATPPAGALPHVEAPPLAPDAPPAAETAPADVEATAPRRRRGRPRKPRADGEASEGEGEEKRAPRVRSTSAETVGGVLDGVEFWHSTDNEPHATVEIDGHHEHLSVLGRSFELFLAERIYDVAGSAPTTNALRDVVRLCCIHSKKGPEHEVFRRVARAGGRIYVDLCDKAWQAIEITADGWAVIPSAAHAVKFLRSRGMQALPGPELSERGIEELREFVNADGPDDFTLVVSWLLAAFGGLSAFPIAVLSGEAGSGKSRLAEKMRALTDPHIAPMRSPPRDLRDLFAGASNQFITCIDNISRMEADLSDSLCRMASGSAEATRALNTNAEEVYLTGARPIILTGIGDHWGQQSDLATRSLAIKLAAIPETERRTDVDLDAAFAATRPRIIGALCDAVSSGLRREGSVRLERLPRLADFARWVTACEPGLGWEEGTLAAALEAGRHESSATAFDADEVAKAIHAFILDDYPVAGWEGTAGRLLTALNARVSEEVRRLRSWPGNPTAMGTRIERVAGLLRWKGFTVIRRRGAERSIVIKPPPAK